jgi:superoxide dismutase, Cu-Zn family
MVSLKGGVVGALAAIVMVPAAAAAASTMVDHGQGPTVVHDPAFDDVRTQVHSWTRDGSTQVRLMVSGLPAGQTFGAHVHTGRCGSDPLASGGHYQHSTDPATPLAERELWLDVTTDNRGRATTTTVVPWTFEPGTAGSVVLHAAPTNPVTGAAGPRLVCTTVGFGQGTPKGGHGGH